MKRSDGPEGTLPPKPPKPDFDRLMDPMTEEEKNRLLEAIEADERRVVPHKGMTIFPGDDCEWLGDVKPMTIEEMFRGVPEFEGEDLFEFFRRYASGEDDKDDEDDKSEPKSDL